MFSCLPEIMNKYILCNSSNCLIDQYCCSVAKSCLTICNSMDCSTPGFPVRYQLLEVAQTHVHWVGDVIQPSHPVVPFSSCLHSFLASGSFPNSQFFASDGQSIGQSISPSNEYSGLISFRKFSLWYLSPNLPRICFFSLPHWNRLHKGRDSLLYPHS